MLKKHGPSSEVTKSLGISNETDSLMIGQNAVEIQSDEEKSEFKKHSEQMRTETRASTAQSHCMLRTPDVAYRYHLRTIENTYSSTSNFDTIKHTQRTRLRDEQNLLIKCSIHLACWVTGRTLLHDTADLHSIRKTSVWPASSMLPKMLIPSTSPQIDEVFVH